MRETGDWEAWIAFFLRGIAETADQSVVTAQKMLRLFADDRVRIEALGRPAASALRLHGLLQQRPLVGVPAAAAQLKLSQPTILAALGHLQRLGVVREATGKRRNRLFVYTAYMALLSEGTEPLPRQ